MKKKITSLALILCLSITTIFSSSVAITVQADETVSGGDLDEVNQGVSISKYVTTTTVEDDDGSTSYEYTLDLEVFTTGIVTTTSTVTTPADIVLVLDQSTSMMWPADQAEDNGLTDGNIGIVDGYYNEDYEWVQAETITVTPLYGVWELSNTDETTYEQSLGITITDGNTTDTVIIDGVTYTYGTSYNIKLSDLSDGWTDAYIAVFGYLYSESRQRDVIESAVDFITELDTEAGHRVSIVTYNSGASVEYPLTGTANTVTNTDEDQDGIYEYDYSDIVDTVLGWATAVNEANANTDGVATSTSSDSNTTTTTVGVQTFNLGHSTEICYGVETAEEILFDAKWTSAAETQLTDEYITSGRTQLAVIFTDGIPTGVGTSSSTEDNVDAALESAWDMKNDDVTVFTIGMLEGVYSDYSEGDDDNDSSNYYADWTNTTTDRGQTTSYYYLTNGNSFISLFLDLLSSNYENASSFPSDDGFPNSSSLYNNDGSTTDTSYQLDTEYFKTVNYVTNEDSEVVADGYTEYYYPIDTSDENVDIASTLNSIFDTVAGMMQGTATFELDEDTQIRDVMTSEYNIPVEFNWVDDDSGEYDYDSVTDTFYYVGAGYGDYEIVTDISVYIAYCTGVNTSANTTDETADDYVDEYDNEYYTWSNEVLVCDSTNGNTDAINDTISIVVRNVYIDISKDDEGNYQYGDYVYYYDDILIIDDIRYLVDSDNNFVDHDGNIINNVDDAIILYPSQQVIVEGFDFNDYYVTTTDKSSDGSGDYGAKLVIEFSIEADTVVVGGDETASDGATIGGNSIETNTSASGVYLYSNDETSGEMGYNAIESFPVPQADVPLDVNLTVNNQTIYLGNAVSIIDLITIDGHTIQGVANAYVDITYTLYEATEISYSQYIALNADEAFISTITYSDGTTEDLYYGYVYDESGNKIEIYSVTIEHGQSASDATGNYNADTLITPESDVDYVVSITVEPNEEGTVESVTYYEIFTVYVLYPEVSANDIWVDYATPVNLRDDNIYQLTDENGTYTSFDSVRVAWDSVSSYDFEIPEPNNAIPPTVTFGFTARRGIEYTAAEFEEWGIREDKEFEITSMTITSSDGFHTVSYFDLDEYEEAELTTFNVTINRFDLDINKTVDADTYDLYPQSFIFDVSYIGSKFDVIQKHVEDENGYVVFTYDDEGTSTHTDSQIYVDTTGYYTGETAFVIYDSDYEVITGEFVTDGALNTSGNNYIVWEEDSSEYSIVYGGNEYFAQLLYEDDRETPVYETVSISDIDKTIEAVVDPDMSNVTTTEWYDSDGTRYYTFTATITDLYCGIEMTVTEETDWSWRYEPGFTTSALTSYVSADSGITLDYTYIDSSSNGEAGTDTMGDYTKYTNTYTSNSMEYTVINTVYTSGELEGYVYTTITYAGEAIYEATSYLTNNYDIDGVLESITQEIRETVSSYKMLDFDEVYSGDYDLGTVSIEGVDYDNYLVEYEFDSVSYVTIAADGQSAVILVSNSEDYLDKNGSNTDYSLWERITETVYFGDLHYYAEDVNFEIDDFTGVGTITYTSTDPAKYTDGVVNIEDPISLTITTDVDADSDDYHLTGIYYYDDDYNKVYGILTEEVVDENGSTVSVLAPTTYYVTTATEMLDESGNVVVDSDGDTVYEYTEGYALQVIENAIAVPAVYFDPIDESLEVYNWLDDDSWLSYSALIENFYESLIHPTLQSGEGDVDNEE